MCLYLTCLLFSLTADGISKLKDLQRQFTQFDLTQRHNLCSTLL